MQVIPPASTLLPYVAGGRLPAARPTTDGAYAGVAQLVERQPSKLKVAGSIPVARFPHGNRERPLSPRDTSVLQSPGELEPDLPGLDRFEVKVLDAAGRLRRTP